MKSNDDKFIHSQLTKEQIEAIENYGKDIKTIENFSDSVRENPGHFLGGINNTGAMNAIREIIQNSFDELNNNESPCNYIKIEFFEGINRCIVSDNGRAIPQEDIIRVFTTSSTSSHYSHKKNVFVSGRNGYGQKCSVAVSTIFKIWSYRLGKGYYMEFIEGKPSKNNPIPKEIPNKNNYQGLTTDFEIDTKIMKEVTLKYLDILNLLEQLIPLSNIGATVDFIGHLTNGDVVKKTLVNNDGLLTFLVNADIKPLIKPIYYEYNNNGIMRCRIAITYNSDINSNTNILSFANMTPVNTQLSTSSQGFFQGVIHFFKNYMNKVYLINSKRKLEIINNDILVGLTGVVDAAHHNMVFDSQSKNVCKQPDLLPFVKEVTIKYLQEWSDKNPEDLQKLCEFFKDVATARTRLDKEKVKINVKYKQNNFTDLPAKYKKAEGKDNLELYLNEGSSAASAFLSARFTKNQASYELKGKIINVFSANTNAILNNPEVRDIITILGAGYGKNFDLSKCPFEKVIILTDADYDGYHIRTLVLKLFLLYFRPLVEDGRLYIALSPLYVVNNNTKNATYFIDKDDFNCYVRDQFWKNNKIQHFKTKKPFNKVEFSSLILNNKDYKSLIETVGYNYAIYPILLEDILILRNESYRKIKTFIEKKYPYLTVKLQSNQVLIDGIAFDASHTIVLNDLLLNSCKSIIPYIDKSEKRYVVNGKFIGLYELLKIYTSTEPKNITRVKGTGELSPYALRESTLDVSHRKLLRYTASDIIREIEEMKKINDDKYSLIKDLDISKYEF